MIRHYDGTPDCAAKISAQAKRGQIVAVFWPPDRHRITGTKKEAERVMQVWKRWKERLGLEPKRAGTAFRTADEAIDIGIYDARSRERV